MLYNQFVAVVVNALSKVCEQAKENKNVEMLLNLGMLLQFCDDKNRELNPPAVLDESPKEE